MASETSHGVTIPEVGNAVKAILCEALAGASVRASGMGLSVSVGATVADMLAALASVRSVESCMMVRSRFYSGDIFNGGSRRGSDKRVFIAGVKAAHGEQYYNALRRYGWVASKWPADRRSDSRPWAWYVNNEPGRPGLPKRERPLAELSLVSRAGDVLTLASPSGIQFVYRIVADVNAGGTEGDGSPRGSGLGVS